LLVFIGSYHADGTGDSFYRDYRDNPSDPLTIIRQGTDRNGQLLRNAHVALMEHHRNDLENEGVDPNSIALPEMGLVSTWDSSFTDIYPGGYFLTDQSVARHIIKPLPNSNIFIGNEAWAALGGPWAEGSLILTERVIYHHMQLPRPPWIPLSYYTDKIIDQNSLKKMR